MLRASDCNQLSGFSARSHEHTDFPALLSRFRGHLAVSFRHSLVRTVELRCIANLPQTCKQDGLITVRMDDIRQIGVK